MARAGRAGGGRGGAGRRRGAGAGPATGRAARDAWPPPRGASARATSPPGRTPTGDPGDRRRRRRAEQQLTAHRRARQPRAHVQRRRLAPAAHAAGRAAPRARGRCARRRRTHPPRSTAALAQVDRLQSTIETLLAVVRGTPAGRADGRPRRAGRASSRRAGTVRWPPRDARCAAPRGRARRRGDVARGARARSSKC